MVKYNTVLLVDDDPTQIAILTAYFASLGVTNIHSASNPTDALKVISKYGRKTDLVVSDLQMPEMDGIEFMRYLKASEFSGKFAIVSGIKRDVLEHAGRLAQMHKLNLIGQIPKPLTKDALDSVFLKTTIVEPRQYTRADIVITRDQFEFALLEDEILPHYQPKVEVNTGKIVGAEALARWKTDDGKNIPPEVFISFAEQNGKISELTYYLFEKTLQDLEKFLAIDSGFRIAVNLAPENIKNIDLPDQINKRMKAAGMTSKNISFEVTENSIINLDSVTLEVLSRLRVLNFEVAIDDFGTGSSNIQTLRDFPYSELKIDRSFITDAISNTFSKQTVVAAVALAQERGMKIVAEGVEDHATWEMLRELGIEQAQGFLLAKAMPTDNFITFLTENKSGIQTVAA